MFVGFCLCLTLLLHAGVFTTAWIASPLSTRRPISTKLQSSRHHEDEYDVIVVGSGVGGLTAAAMLSLYNTSVLVLESHTHPGGAAHGFTIRDKDTGGMFSFDTGPSFFSGLDPTLAPKLSNPLRTVLDAIGEKVECIPYTSFGLVFPEGNFIHTPNFANTVLRNISGTESVQQWETLMERMKPLERAVAALPTAALRFDVGAALTVAPFMGKFITATNNPLGNLQLTQPFANIIEKAGIKDGSFVKNWLDLLCFCLSGLPSSGTITAEMGLMMGEFYDEEAIMDCPRHGAQSIVEALVRGITKNGGSVVCNSHVEKIVIANGQATGVQLKKGARIIKARQAVISNLSVWDLLGSGIVDPQLFPASHVKERLATPVGDSFMHLHVGFTISRKELQEMQAHYMYIDDWSRGVQAEENAVLVSIPSVHDDTLAPEGYAVMHLYTPATESFARWEHLKRNTPEYEALKKDRSVYLWKVAEKILPGIQERAKVVRVGTPLTHKRFLRRHRGSYGPAIEAGKGSFPFPQTPIKGLLTCGDSCFPGIGIPAVSGSGLLAAHAVSLDSVLPQVAMLDRIKSML